jgi:HPt (histidine-containing phosphotransfer) domain-containing protein
MGLANEMKSLSEEMFSSFKERVQNNEELVADVEKKLKKYRNEQEKTAANLAANAHTLKKNLAVGEKDRLSKYNQLIGSIQKDIKIIENEVKGSTLSTNALIKDFSKERKVLARDLDKFFTEENKLRAQNEEARMAEYELYIGKINDEVSSIFNYTNEMLEKFGAEHKEMSAELRADLNKNQNERFEYTHALLKSIQDRIAEISNENLDAARKLKTDLSNGEVDRIKDFNALFDRISREVTELRKSTASLLGNYSNDRSQGAEYWKHMQEKIAAIRSGGEAVVEKTIEKNEVKVEPAAVNKVLPVFEEKVPVVNIEMPIVKNEITLEDKIFQYINSHHEGVKVSDMEEPLHETRMKIGFAAKCLLDAGKVSKVENLYYPVKKNIK